MLQIFTDFGWNGPYTGQMKACLNALAPGHNVVDLMHDAPRFNPKAAAYLLAALQDYMPAGAVSVCVVDPGVGGPRKAVAIESGSHWFIGPDNGLLAIVARRRDSRLFEITWRPDNLSASFHGRDLFAPAAAKIAIGDISGLAPMDSIRHADDWPDDLAEVIYIDDFGNAMTGLRASRLAPDATVTVNGHSLPRGRTFSDTPPGTAFCYENALGLIEVAVNRGSAQADMTLAVGSPVESGN